MIFYGFVVMVVLAVGTWLFRSPVTKQFLRGRGTDPGQFGSRLDHLEDLGSGTGWNDDGAGGKRDSHRDSKQATRRR